MDDALIQSLVESPSRPDLWVRFIEQAGIREIAEVGVYRGLLSEELLRRVPGITRYYLIDPWRHLSDWNKPANQEDTRFEEIYREAMTRTEHAADRRVVLRGTTTEVIDQIPDGTLDLAYIDGDHTLRGIAIDLIRVYPKIREGGYIGGDDLAPSIWQHATEFEPTLVFPFTVYFAEAVGAPIHALPHRQFLIRKIDGESFGFTDLVGRYPDTTLRRQMLKGMRRAMRQRRRDRLGTPAADQA